MADPKIEKWLRWMDVIHDEIQHLLVAEHLFWETQKLIKRRKSLLKPSAYYRYMGDAHIALVLSGIRRQIKIDSESISFARLLNEISIDADKLSRAYYCGLYKGSVVEDLANRHFDRIAGKGKKRYPKSKAKADLKKLKARALECETFADRRIAHRDSRPPSHVPTFGQATKCIRLMNRMWCRYKLLLSADHYDTLMPTFQYDWAEVFDQRWRNRRAI